MSLLDKLNKVREKQAEQKMPAKEEVIQEEFIQEEVVETPKKVVKKKPATSKKDASKPLVLCGCAILNRDLQTPTQILSEYVDKVLETRNALVLSAVPYNEGSKDLSLLGNQLLDDLVAHGHFRLDQKLPVDSLIYSLIFQLKRENDFVIVRSVF